MRHLYIYLILKDIMLPGQLECHKICPGREGGMIPCPRLTEQEREVKREERREGRAPGNPYYMIWRERELFKKLFVVLFL